MANENVGRFEELLKGSEEIQAKLKQLAEAFEGDKNDAKAIDFDDAFIYSEFALSPEQRSMPREQMLRDEAIVTFQEWMKKDDKVEY